MDPGPAGDRRPAWRRQICRPGSSARRCRCSEGTVPGSSVSCRAGVGEAEPQWPKSPSPFCSQPWHSPRLLCWDRGCPGPCPWGEVAFPGSAMWLEPFRADRVRGCSGCLLPEPRSPSPPQGTPRCQVLQSGSLPCPAAGCSRAQTPWKQPPSVGAPRFGAHGHGFPFRPPASATIPLCLGTNAPSQTLPCQRQVNTVPTDEEPGEVVGGSSMGTGTMEGSPCVG